MLADTRPSLHHRRCRAQDRPRGQVSAALGGGARCRRASRRLQARGQVGDPALRHRLRQSLGRARHGLRRAHARRPRAALAAVLHHAGGSERRPLRAGGRRHPDPRCRRRRRSGRSAFPATRRRTTRSAASPASRRPASRPIRASIRPDFLHQADAACRSGAQRACPAHAADPARRSPRPRREDVRDLGLEAVEEQPRLRRQRAPRRLDHDEFGVERRIGDRIDHETAARCR